ncbi:MAG TPA: hypothetical protein V6D27_01065 [Vampirovibrionales bacterium]
MKLPTNPTPEQATQIGKILVKRILEELYVEGIHDLTVAYGTNPVAYGRFVAKNRTSKGTRPEFSFTITAKGSKFETEYKAIAGTEGIEDPTDMGEPASDVLPRILGRTAADAVFAASYQENLAQVRERGAEGFDAYWYAEYLTDLNRNFEEELNAVLESQAA